MISKRQALKRTEEAMDSVMQDAVRKLRRALKSDGASTEEIADSVDAAIAMFENDRPEVIKMLETWLDAYDTSPVKPWRIYKRQGLH